MTFREKLQQEHPDKARPCFDGGCDRCPCDYGYEAEQGCPKDDNILDCADCWDREIPGTEPTKPVKKKIVYISGPITGVERYWLPFEQAEDDLTAMGYVALNPAKLPEGMSKWDYMRICLSMVDVADVVVALPGHENSAGAKMEKDYAAYIGKPWIAVEPDGIDALRAKLKEVLT